MHTNSPPGEIAQRTAVRKLTITADDADQRIDNFLRRHLPGVPKSRVYRFLRRGEVRVNGGRVRADHRLQTGDVVRIPPAHINKAAPPPARSRVDDLAASVIFEDKYLLVINKPGGVAVHGGSGISHGVVELLRAARPQFKDLSLVHRLDRETSGCLVLAKRRSALRALHQLFREGRVEKNYLALVAGDWQQGEQLIDAPLLVTNRRGGERHVVVATDGKAAKTRVKLSRAYGNYSLMQCQPLSGRTHQIRVHLAAAGHPIAGDERYGNPDVNARAHAHGLQRLFLHAQSISFPDLNGNEQHFVAPLADDLESFLQGGVSGRKRRRSRSTTK
ncbi:MAG: RluA family pseudouridine synthase [Woeseia sp.]|nr:RluA family pseudouridine synthase [Woeseia sp.]MBT8097086.1 RluA family pseudouridine synthase [Woeseia sp.]NNE62058.1 RluA family pseudouridine synthase [Woeseia sp.]NNL53669.1 RluA family pseudouridine synthase [Woeseia sp.]